MKRVLSFFAILFLATGLSAQETTETKTELDPNRPIFHIENKTINYGEVVKGEDDGVRHFKFTNTGKSPLKLVNVRSSCGCTVPSYSKEPVMPGEEGEITVRYNMKPGPISKSITVTTNGDPQRIVLRIKGKVIVKETKE